jgi:hypothetical protein
MELLEKKETAVLTRRPFDAGGIIPEMRLVLARPGRVNGATRRPASSSRR